jgi:hypothetical protein
MTLSTWFEGDPESCWRVARRLDSLAETMEQTGRFLGHQASLPADEFEGLSGNAYRASAGTLRDEAVDAATAQRALASALDEFATNLDGVRRILRRARALARDHLVIHGLEIQEPGAYADERQREVFAMVEGVVHEARRIEPAPRRSRRSRPGRPASRCSSRTRCRTPIPSRNPRTGPSPSHRAVARLRHRRHPRRPRRPRPRRQPPRLPSSHPRTTGASPPRRTGCPRRHRSPRRRPPRPPSRS